ncbi:MAG TPA: hypothetical protein VMW54_02260 [Terriglobia bacterium]|nr:hypothetical protein [Terriglobia bacterium]
MRNRSSRIFALALLALAGVFSAGVPGLQAANLRPAATKAFERYVQAAEARMAREGRQPGDFLYIEQLPKPQYDQVMSMLKQGQVYVTRLQTLDAAGKAINVPGGMIHHWTGDVFIPGTSLTSAFKALRNYNNYKEIYKPQIVRSRLVSRHGDDYKIYLRLQKSSIVTVTLDTWYDIRFSQIDATQGYTRSFSTRIQQVEDAGMPSEHRDPVGNDSGYLWRINSYWRYEQVQGGMIIEWESISLSRPIPFLLAWFVKPLIRNIARETVADMLTATRKAVLAEKAQQDQAKTSGRSRGRKASPEGTGAK